MTKKADYLENTLDFSLCCGCRACEQVCTRKAISMKENHEGFLYPVVDDSLCVNCGACASVCPFMNSAKVKSNPHSVFAAINQNLTYRKKSSSGGVFSALSIEVLKRNGAIYGAAFDCKMELSHRRVADVKHLVELMGSKYVQSDTSDTYRQVKKDLTDGSWVLFSGTPCQIAGLRLFLRKDYERLITVDIVCHGTPSVKMFGIFLNELERKYKEKVVGYNFRDKRVNGWSCSSSCTTENKQGRRTERMYDRIMNAYSDAFLSGKINRECCYKCPFAEKKRVGDFTLADYWGVQSVFPEIDYHEGVSILAVNTEKGEKFLASEKINLQLIQSDYETAANAGGNLQMLQPSIRSDDRDWLYRQAFSETESFIRSFYRKKEFRRKLLFVVKGFVRRNKMLYVFFQTLKKMT